MRKVILYLQISLDGVISESDQWMSFSDDILKDTLDYYKTVDTGIFGSNTYPFLSEYWQTAEKSSNNPLEKEFAKQINNIDKFVLSRSSVELTWKNSHHLKFTDNESFIKVIQDLKSKPGKSISVESGIKIWKAFLQNNLFDELLLYVHPVIAGNGVKLFDEISTKTTLKLKSSKTLDKDVIKLYYEIHDRTTNR